mmetsp:Transcript_41157/g.117657  ORF Transcript_41157/g.117657 Transcript_41157/m.117657 type:complete len:311 (+) Transcript_41157:109-1041(+)
MPDQARSRDAIVAHAFLIQLPTRELADALDGRVATAIAIVTHLELAALVADHPQGGHFVVQKIQTLELVGLLHFRYGEISPSEAVVVVKDDRARFAATSVLVLLTARTLGAVYLVAIRPGRPTCRTFVVAAAGAPGHIRQHACDLLPERRGRAAPGVVLFHEQHRVCVAVAVLQLNGGTCCTHAVMCPNALRCVTHCSFRFHRADADAIVEPMETIFEGLVLLVELWAFLQFYLFANLLQTFGHREAFLFNRQLKFSACPLQDRAVVTAVHEVQAVVGTARQRLNPCIDQSTEFLQFRGGSRAAQSARIF